jgi:hypothetical protein
MSVPQASRVCDAQAEAFHELDPDLFLVWSTALPASPLAVPGLRKREWLLRPGSE